MNCPHCGKELHSEVYINAMWVGYYCPWCDKDIPNDPEPVTVFQPIRRSRQ